MTGKKWLVLLSLLLLVLTSGCNTKNDQTDPSSGSAGSASSQTNASKPASGPVNCNWTLSINDTVIDESKNGMKYTLTVNAVKKGGKSELGTYTGTAVLSYKYSMSSGPVSGNAEGKAQDAKAVFKVVKFDNAAFTDYKPQEPLESLTPDDLAPLTPSEDPLAPLVGQDAMALGMVHLKGGGTAQENAGGSWNTDGYGTKHFIYKVRVNGGKVELEMPELVPGKVFKGMITGEPI